jgi:hypothetical protein
MNLGAILAAVVAMLIAFAAKDLLFGPSTPPPPPPPPTTTEVLSNLTAWATRLGAKLDSLVVRPSPIHGLGTFASREIRSGENIICVPSRLWVSEDNLKRTGIAPIVDDAATLGALQILAVFAARMLYDRAAEPKGAKMFGRYFDQWPTGDELPLTWGEAALQGMGIGLEPLLPYYPAVEEVLKRHPDIFGSPLRPAYSEDNFTRAFALVSSRVVGPVSEQATKKGPWGYHVLIPMLDFMNHEPQGLMARVKKTIRSWVPNRNDTAVCLVAQKAYKTGQEVFTFYGNEPLPKFFATYGFIHDDHFTDSTTLRIPGQAIGCDPRLTTGFHSNPPHEPTEDRKGVTYHVRIGKENADAFLPWARILSLPPGTNRNWADIDKYCQRAMCRGKLDFKKTLKEHGGCGISEENERNATALVKKTLTDLVYNTGAKSLEGEQAKVKEELAKPAASRDYKALTTAQYRARMKRLLLDSVAVFENPSLRTPIKISDGGWDEVKQD